MQSFPTDSLSAWLYPCMFLRFTWKNSMTLCFHQCSWVNKVCNVSNVVEGESICAILLSYSMCIKMECKLLIRINTTSLNTNNPIFPPPNSLNITHLEWDSACMLLSLVCEVLISCCWAQRRKELITYSERFTSYYRTTPTVHWLRCAFICLLLY